MMIRKIKGDEGNPPDEDKDDDDEGLDIPPNQDAAHANRQAFSNDFVKDFVKLRKWYFIWVNVKNL